jgi:hypothetical protein
VLESLSKPSLLVGIEQVHLVDDDNGADADEFRGDQVLVDQIAARLGARGDDDCHQRDVGGEGLVAPAVVGSAQRAVARLERDDDAGARLSGLPDDAIAAHRMADVAARLAKMNPTLRILDNQACTMTHDDATVLGLGRIGFNRHSLGAVVEQEFGAFLKPLAAALLNGADALQLPSRQAPSRHQRAAGSA